ncbi:hypothetical protein [Caulobacter mirabilis]|uniref:Uncharacterized protein n=1 Tax=Caulobacter mirabilis TaxID=69666 RepID=A0A2D2AT54_9CAUL|nr:hypothetical protein [Caulobacter mirabilis]ATQ41145.1 hypothetical protein CSW64_01325 [Caulobacter mirabilis]
MTVGKLFSGFIAVALLFSFLATPPLDPLGPFEIGLIAVLVGGFFISIIRLFGGDMRTLRQDRSLWLVAFLYLTSFAISAVMSVVKGTDITSVITSTAPYVGIILLGLPWWLLRGAVEPTTLDKALIGIGLLQALYIIYLFLSNTPAFDAQSILFSRITFLDGRISHPLFLVGAVVAFVFAAAAVPGSRRQWTLASVVLACIVAAMMTQTRSHILCIIGGIITALILIQFFPPQNAVGAPKRLSKQMRWAMVIGLVAFFALIFFTPYFTVFIEVMLTRQREQGDGRIDSEWIPALRAYQEGGLITWLFGTGAGVGFVTYEGDVRAYVHNIFIYFLLYNGVFGVGCLIALWTTLGFRLLGLWRRNGDSTALALLASLVCLFMYAQLFAVHKALSFNLLLWVAMSYVMTRPAMARRPVRAVGVQQVRIIA